MIGCVGTWGVKLYSDDFASDLRATIGAICRLPLTGEQIVLRQFCTQTVPDNPESVGNSCSSAWVAYIKLVPLSEEEARALAADRNRKDTRRLAEADVKERERDLTLLRDKLQAPIAAKPRKTLKKPQALLYSAGDVLTYPVDSRGNCYNPYLANSALRTFITTGWGGCMVLSTGHALQFLAWYQIAPCRGFWKERPSFEEVSAQVDAAGAKVGTLSKAHVARMRLELLGKVRRAPIVPPPNPGRIISVVTSDISASNILCRWLAPGSITSPHVASASQKGEQ